MLHGDGEGEHEPLKEEAIVDEPQDPKFDLKALKDAIDELYGGSKCTKLVATILLMNLCIVHGINNKFAYELFAFLHLHLLLVDNCLPNNYYIVKTLTRILRLDYKNIHACGKRCVLYQGKYKYVVYCPKCGAFQYKDEGNKLFLVKVLRHFPIIPRLQRMFRTPTCQNSCYGIHKTIVKMGLLDINVTPKHGSKSKRSSQHLL